MGGGVSTVLSSVRAAYVLRVRYARHARAAAVVSPPPYTHALCGDPVLRLERAARVRVTGARVRVGHRRLVLLLRRCILSVVAGGRRATPSEEEEDKDEDDDDEEEARPGPACAVVRRHGGRPGEHHLQPTRIVHGGLHAFALQVGPGVLQPVRPFEGHEVRTHDAHHELPHLTPLARLEDASGPALRDSVDRHGLHHHRAWGGGGGGAACCAPCVPRLSAFSHPGVRAPAPSGRARAVVLPTRVCRREFAWHCRESADVRGRGLRPRLDRDVAPRRARGTTGGWGGYVGGGMGDGR
eukprot:gene4168-biopygen14436